MPSPLPSWEARGGEASPLTSWEKAKVKGIGAAKGRGTANKTPPSFADHSHLPTTNTPIIHSTKPQNIFRQTS